MIAKGVIQKKDKQINPENSLLFNQNGYESQNE